MKRSELVFTALLIPLDALMLFAAFVAAYYLRDNFTLLSPGLIGGLSTKLQYNPASQIEPFGQYLHYVWYLIPGMVVIFAISGLYSISRSARFWERLSRIVLGVSVGLFFILLLFLFKRDFFLPRTTVLYSWVLGIIFVTAGRFSVRMLQRTLYKAGIGAVRVGVLGNSDMAKKLVKRLTQRWRAQYVLAELSGDDVDELLPTINRDSLDELLVVNDKFSIEDLIRLRNHCLEQHVSFGFSPRAFTALQGAAYVIRDEVGFPIIEVRPTPLDGWGRISKRIFDIVISLLLIVLCSPFYLIIGIALLVTSGGSPLVFRHKRIGRAGQVIYVSKYRSMRPEWSDKDGKLSPLFAKYLKENTGAQAEWDKTMKLKDDPRISRIGKFLRATRLDELPQFFDVLRGDLSLVGPRPIIQAEVERFGEKARILFHVRPGVTGPWQVAGGNSLTYEERVSLNADYIEHWSLWLDTVILVKTAGVVIGGVIKKIAGKDSEEGY